MNTIQEKIHEIFESAAIYRSSENDSLFTGRNLPSFVKHFILLKFMDKDGNVDEDKVRDYLEEKMPTDTASINLRLMRGDPVNMTARFTVNANLTRNQMEFTIPDAQIMRNAIVSPTLVDELVQKNILLTDGEHWGNFTLTYMQPVGKEPGYIIMTTLKMFQPYQIDINHFRDIRSHFSVEEWIDVILCGMEYNPDSFSSLGQKLEFISRLLPFVEANLSSIELGPKSTGKSYIYNNFSKYGWMVSGGKTSRARLFYNKANRQYGVFKNFDVVALDEIENFQFADEGEMLAIFKGYLEAGFANVDKVRVQSEAGLALMGNIVLNSQMEPQDELYYKHLHSIFRDSAMLDRFHSFTKGWLLPRITTGARLQGWTVNSEYFSSVLHQMRSVSDYRLLFHELVAFDDSADCRDTKAVERVCTAFSKLLFPHITSLDDLEEGDVDNFKELYRVYCLEPAINRRAIIRMQCHYIDPEYKVEMPEFTIK